MAAATGQELYAEDESSEEERIVIRKRPKYKEESSEDDNDDDADADADADTEADEDEESDDDLELPEFNEKAMGTKGGPFTEADFAILSRHVAAIPNFEEANNTERWQKFVERVSFVR